MKKNSALTLFSVLIATAVLLTACVSTINMDSLNNLQVGMSQTQAANILQAQPVKTLSLMAQNKLVHVDVYQLANGDYVSNYLVAYDENNALLYWGYPNEFARSTNRFINKIGVLALAALQ